MFFYFVPASMLSPSSQNDMSSYLQHGVLAIKLLIPGSLRSVIVFDAETTPTQFVAVWSVTQATRSFLASVSHHMKIQRRATDSVLPYFDVGVPTVSHMFQPEFCV